MTYRRMAEVDKVIREAERAISVLSPERGAS